MAGGFPRVLADELFQLRVADAIDEGRDRAEKLALDLEEQAQEAGHFIDRGHAAGGRRGCPLRRLKPWLQRWSKL